MSSKLWTEEQFNCPVCLDLPNDPVTIPCGHSYCMACIKDYWSKDDPKGTYSCPQCRQAFSPKPSLSRNTMLAEAVEQLRKGASKSDAIRNARRASSDSTKPKRKLSSSTVTCDMCKGDRRAAVKSCLACMSSYCDAHLKPHKTKKALKQHELIAPTGNLAEKICTQHKYLQEFFCRQCKIFICWLCTSDLHKGHECVSTKVERLEKQKVISEVQVANQQRLKDREQELKDMKTIMEGMKLSSERVHDDTEQVLSELQRSMERLQELVEELLDQASMEKMGQAQEVADSLEAEIKERKRRDTDMKDLGRCEDHIHYLQAYESMISPLESGELPAVAVNPDASFEPVRDAILDLRERVEDLCNQELGKITKHGLGFQSQDVRSRNAPRVRETNPRPSPTPSPAPSHRASQSLGSRFSQNQAPSPTPSPTPSHRASQSLGSRFSQNQAPSATPSPTPSRKESQSLGSRFSQNQAPSPTPSRKESRSTGIRSSQNQVAHAESPIPTPAPAPASSGGFSRMASISSLFRSHRRGIQQATPATSAIPFDNTPSAGGNPLREISIDSIQAPEPRSREEFLQYSVNLTLDPNTAHRRLALSEGNTKALLQVAAQPFPDTPQRFDGWTQVMCQSALYGQHCYWEVEWRGRGSSVGVAYGALNRKGSDARSGLGYNAQSWTLELSDTCCSAMHANEKRDIPVTYSPRLGIFLDQSMGTLAFHSVAESMTHLHTFRANFTQPLYAAFGVGSGVGVGLDFALGKFTSSSDSIKICPM
ncbi:E3 ubiquitin/ISG15 ligase TRIM25 [Limanda limanda]|uniref:E3 ubiquitin/ISG15 ligase TRIM25 n=1 Tax=Limanda limanda TaxID=27771 RepID=UPI0029C7F62E|nr:E3 ubiquitin/ISG15 ligase TRIM25 [Limanda limanda]